MAAAGFDPRRDLREILVSSTGQLGSGGAGVFLARGAFDVPKIIEAAGAISDTYKGVSMVKVSAQELAFPDSTLAIFGDAAAVRAAIDRISAPTAILATDMAVLVNELSVTEDAWFVSMAPIPQLQAAGAPGPIAMLNNVKQASGGLKFGANVVLSLQLFLQTDQDAAALAIGLKAAPGIATMGGDPKGNAAIASLLQSLNVTADGSIVKILWSVPEAQIEQRMRPSEADAPVRARPPAPAAAPAPSTGEVPQRIRVGSAVQAAKLIEYPRPVYPALAKQARISGVVRLNVVIGKDGTVENSAMEAVKQWVYQPTLLNGQPVEVVTQVEVSFTLEE